MEITAEGVEKATIVGAEDQCLQARPSRAEKWGGELLNLGSGDVEELGLQVLKTVLKRLVLREMPGLESEAEAGWVGGEAKGVVVWGGGLTGQGKGLKSVEVFEKLAKVVGGKKGGDVQGGISCDDGASAGGADVKKGGRGSLEFIESRCRWDLCADLGAQVGIGTSIRALGEARVGVSIVAGGQEK